VRGFAVTLTLGILASMFTAIFVSRIFFDAWLPDGSLEPNRAFKSRPCL
jgi:preprotein translocase subunit SecD